MKGDKYTCAMCGRTYLKEDEDVANAECEKYFGVKNASERLDMAIVCDDCFMKIHPAEHPEKVMAARAELSKEER